MAKKKAKLRLDASTWALMRRLLKGYVRPHAWRIVAALVCMAVVAAATAAMAQIMEPLINKVFDERNEEALWAISIGILVIFTAKGLAEFGEGVLMSHVGNRIVAELQGQLFHKLLKADLAFFTNTSPGTLVSRFINDVNLLKSSVSTSLTGFGKDALTAIALIGVMFWQDWRLALIAFVAFPTAVLPIVRVGRRMRKVSGTTQTVIGRLTTLLDESFQGIRHVKAYGMERHESERSNRAFYEIFRLNQKAAIIRNVLSPIMDVLAGFAIVGVLAYGASQVLYGGRDPGSFFAFITAVLLAYEPVRRLAKLNAELQQGMAAADRVFHLMDQEPAIKDAPGARPLAVEGGRVELRDVRFAYVPGANALDGVTITAPPGKTIALVGASGAGKSTILNLLPRFYDVDEGAVLIDGQDARGVTLATLRGAMALVSQEVILFDDTVKANIAYGRTGASDAEIVEAARHAQAHDFIAELPQGYDTPVGPRGTKLSGGQRQRVAIARAMLKNAPILLLDEATSALDTESERKVQQALKELMRGRTTLVIAHRLSTVIDADIIYVLHQGRVIEQGSHVELLQRDGAYAQLYRQQFAAESDAEAVAETAAGPAAASRWI